MLHRWIVENENLFLSNKLMKVNYLISVPTKLMPNVQKQYISTQIILTEVNVNLLYQLMLIKKTFFTLGQLFQEKKFKKLLHFYCHTGQVVLKPIFTLKRWMHAFSFTL